MSKFLNGLGWIVEKSSLAKWLLVAIIIVEIIDVLLRELFDSPTMWAFETTGFLLLGLSILPAAFTLKSGGHVSIDIIFLRFPERVRQRLKIIALFIVFFAALPLAVRTIIYAQYTTAIRDSTGSVWNPPLYPVIWVMAIGWVLLCIEALRQLLKSLSKRRA